MQARAYLRVSTEEQAEEGFSIPTQRQRVTDFCRSQWGEATRIVWYVDEGQSARNTKRPALSLLRAEAEPGDLIIVLRLDRLTRSVLDLYTLLQEWEQRSVFFRSVTEPYDTSSTEGRFMIGLLALLAEWERLRIAERVREVMIQTVRQEGRHLSRPPLGYRLSHGRLEIDPAEAAQVREVYSRFAAGQGSGAIARALNQKGLRTKQGREWTDFTVTYVLHNPIYTGRVAWGRIVRKGKRKPDASSGEPLLVDASHPPLVERAVWDQVQQRLGGRQGRTARETPGTYPLSGLARCGLCGGPLHGLTQRRHTKGQGPGGRVHRYYRCANRDRKGTCSLPYLPAEQVENQVLGRLGCLGTPETLRLIAERFLPAAGPEKDPLEAERQEIRRRLGRWDQAYEAGDLGREEWRTLTAALRRRLAERNLALPETGDAAAGSAHRSQIRAGDVAELLADLPAIWRRLTPEERRSALHGLVEQIGVMPDGSARLTLRPYLPLPVAPSPAKGTP